MLASMNHLLLNLRNAPLLVVVAFIAWSILLCQQDNNSAQTTASANSLFENGQFAQAERLYMEAANRNPKDYHSTLRVGEIALLSNRFSEAEKWLIKAADLKSEEAAAKSLLAESYYRRDEFLKASSLLSAAGQEAVARKLAS